jgi:adenylate cyclase
MNAGAKVLVVDDVAQNVELLCDLLQAKGYVVETAYSGAQALRKVSEVRPDVVLLDVVMPDLNGYEVCTRIKQMAGDQILPVVLVTALDPVQERIKGLEAGADDFLTKPINQAELLVRVRSLARMKALYDTVEMQKAQLSGRVAQLKRFFTPRLAELIASEDKEDPLQSRRQEVTIVFLDLRGFTEFADSFEPEEVMSVLRAYHEAMGQLMLEFDGNLEHFAGDGMMILFNAPMAIPNPAQAAVRMAVKMQEKFCAMLVEWEKSGYQIGLGIGIAHGFATVGAIGFEGRLAYGTIGSVVNMAARLCAEAKSGQILVSQKVFSLVDSISETTPVGALQLKGFVRPVPAHNVVRLKALS